MSVLPSLFTLSPNQCPSYLPYLLWVIISFRPTFLIYSIYTRISIRPAFPLYSEHYSIHPTRCILLWWILILNSSYYFMQSFRKSSSFTFWHFFNGLKIVRILFMWITANTFLKSTETFWNWKIGEHHKHHKIFSL